MFFIFLVQKITKLFKIVPKIGLFLIIFILFSCAVGPDFKKPKVDWVSKKSNFLNSANNLSDKQYPINKWWLRFNDSLLNNYITTLLKQNLDIKAGAQRVEQAKQQVKIQTGSYFPTIGLDNSVSRTVRPGNVFLPTLPADPIYQTNYEFGATSSWELDLFGRLRRLSESAGAEFSATKYDQEALKHSLIASLAKAKIAVFTNKELLILAKKIAANRRKAYDLMKFRYERGANNVSIAELYLAKQELSEAKNNSANLEMTLAKEIYALDILLGFKPGTIDPFKVTSNPVPPPLDVATCLPLSLIDRRPDLKAAEFRIKAQNANIGVAVADLYPNLTFSGSVGVSGNSTNNIFDSRQLTGSIIGSSVMKIFQGGKLRANVKAQKAKTKELAFSYSKNVLNAIKEVEENLVDENETGKQLNNAQITAKTAKEALLNAKKRYEIGAINLKTFLDVEQKALQALQNLSLIEQKKWNARISLLLSLGGDWFGNNFSTNFKCGVAK